MSDLDELQRQIGEWGYATFPSATDRSVLAHFLEEAIELNNAILSRDWDDPTANIAEEAADCATLIIQLAHRNGFSLFEAVRKKFDVNQRRTWHQVDAGYSKHDEVSA